MAAQGPGSSVDKVHAFLKQVKEKIINKEERQITFVLIQAWQNSKTKIQKLHFVECLSKNTAQFLEEMHQMRIYSTDHKKYYEYHIRLGVWADSWVHNN